MPTIRTIAAASLAASLLLCLAPQGPVTAGVGARADIDDLQGDYFGFWATSNGENGSGTVDFDLSVVKGTQFGGTLAMIGSLSRGVGAEGIFATNVGGSVSSKGKLQMSGDIDSAAKFKFKGKLSDQGFLIQGNWNIKDGNSLLAKGPMTFIVD